MELKVWLDGTQRIVCGVTESTTCQDVVYALAHATAQTGRFTLIERWRSNERLLAPHESPIANLMKWGEYAPEIQFVLRRSVPESNKGQQPALGVQGNYKNRPGAVPGPSVQSSNSEPVHEDGKSSGPPLQLENTQKALDRNQDVRKSFTVNGILGNVPENNVELHMENVAIVQPTLQSKARVSSIRKTVKKNVESPASSLPNEGSVNTAQQKVRELPPYRDPPGPMSSVRTLPPYRDPPPPNSNSPSRSQYPSDLNSLGSFDRKENPSSPRNSMRLARNLVQAFPESKSSLRLGCSPSEKTPSMVTMAYTQRYVELIRLVNRQRDTIDAQQADLTKYDAEILYWETKSREQTHQMDFISQEVNRIESTGRVIEEQLKEFAHAEEESEIVRQQEKTLKSEITLLRSKLANCETELLQCKNKMRLVAEELALEQHNICRELNERQIMEHKVMRELEHLQEEVEHAKQTAEITNHCAESLKAEVSNLEAIIVEKKMHVERLVSDMKEANLQSLMVACQDEQVKYLLEGMQKPGSTRKIIGSPRQLETAVPTSKNPHGVWV